ncbi:MAG TPA: hypothetical protein VJ828_05780 [Lacipirellulaceae bacterium]|nr:hypothetical protein [Lacipirellulaceae bacterium]
MSRTRRTLAVLFQSAAVAVSVQLSAYAGTPFVPGTGEFLADVCDDFEDPNWSYRYNHPKSSHEQDDKQRSPGGRSANGLWHEGGKRGTPDLVKRVDTPPDGIDGSTGAMLFATKNSGIPGRVSNSQMQDDILMMFDRKLGRPIPISWQPSCTVRVYLPPFDQWENRTGAQFGMRADCRGQKSGEKPEEYWPGMFFLFRSETSRNIEQDFAKLTIRADRRGHDVRSIDITEPGWWTLGMSFTADGQVHYYASPGVDDLTEEDYLMSNFPYNMKGVSFHNFFFNVANWDNGRTWSTQWVIDDPKIFVIPPEGRTVAQLYRFKKQPQQRQQVSRNRTRRPAASSARSMSTSSRGRNQR